MIINTKSHEWSNWFAWFPVRTEKGELVWFETIERKLQEVKIQNCYPTSYFVYRKIDNKPKGLVFAGL